MNNYMKQVATMLGVEFGTYFKVNGKKYYITDKGLTHRENNDIFLCPLLLNSLLTGDAVIEQTSWKPKNGDKYWWIDVKNGCVFFNIWDDNGFDFMLYYADNCFSTSEEAELHVQEMTNKMQNKYEQ